jgi:uncharacterized membrane protein
MGMTEATVLILGIAKLLMALSAVVGALFVLAIILAVIGAVLVFLKTTAPPKPGKGQ